MNPATEFFLLRSARTLSSRLESGARARIGRSISLARQRARAADGLWTAGQLAEAYALMSTALDIAATASRELAGQLDPPGSDSNAHRALDRLLALRGVPSRRAREIRSAIAELDTVSPELDIDVSPAHAARFERMARAVSALVDAVLDPARHPAELDRLRALRVGAPIALVALMFAVYGVIALRRTAARHGEEEPLVVAGAASSVSASTTFGNGSEFPPAHAADGDPSTEWLMPDRHTGWLEVALPEPQRVSRVSIVSSRNPPFFDRAPREYRVELYRGDVLAAAIEGTVTEIAHDPEPIEHSIPPEDGITRIRFVVLSYHGMGGGLAEIAWMP